MLLNHHGPTLCESVVVVLLTILLVLKILCDYIAFLHVFNLNKAVFFVGFAFFDKDLINYVGVQILFFYLFYKGSLSST